MNELYKIGDTVDVEPLPGDHTFDTFTGRIISFKSDCYQVQDQDGDVFDCLSEQLTIVSND